MNRKHLFIAMTIASMACLSGCKSEKKATTMQFSETEQEMVTDSVENIVLETDSVVFEKSTKGLNVRWLWISQRGKPSLTKT